MYNNYFNNPYQMPQMGQIQRQDVVHVNGENGARSYQLAPNSNALLLDDTAPLVWLVQADGAGYRTVTPYKIEPYTPEPVAQASEIKSLEERISRIEEVLRNEPDIKQT